MKKRELIIAKIGKRYGRLTLIEDIRCDGSGHRKWRLRCDCGAEKTTIPTNIIRGVGLGCAKRGGIGNLSGMCSRLDADRKVERPPMAVAIKDTRDLHSCVPVSVFDLGRVL